MATQREFVKFKSDINKAIRGLTKFEKEMRVVAGYALRQTATQVRNEGARRIKKTRYASAKFTLSVIKQSIWVEKKAPTGMAYAIKDQSITITFGGRAIPIMYFNPKEYIAGSHPFWGNLWATDIRMWGRKVKTGAFHLRGNAIAKNPNFKSKNARENMQRGGWGNHPGGFTRNSKLFFRKFRHEGGKSLPLEKFLTFSVGGLMASPKVGLQVQVQKWANNQLHLNFVSQYYRREGAILRGFGVK